MSNGFSTNLSEFTGSLKVIVWLSQLADSARLIYLTPGRWRGAPLFVRCVMCKVPRALEIQALSMFEKKITPGRFIRCEQGHGSATASLLSGSLSL